jgi:predicted DNA binding CopG/RHH family protein
MQVYCVDARLKFRFDPLVFKELISKLSEEGYLTFKFNTWNEIHLIINLEKDFKINSEILRPKNVEKTLLFLYPVTPAQTQLPRKSFPLEKALELGVSCISYSMNKCSEELNRFVDLISKKTGINDPSAIFIPGNVDDETKINFLDELILNEGKFTRIYLTHEREDIKKVIPFVLNKENRDLLMNIKLKKFVQPSEFNDKLVQKMLFLHDNQLIQKEYAVSCSKCKKHIFTLDVIEELDETLRGKKCACGALLSDQKYISEVFRVTKSVEDALNQGAWLVMKIKDILKSLGVVENYIRVGIEINGNEIDLAFAHLGQFVLVECKTGRFDLGHAFNFSGKIFRFKPDYAIIVTIEGIDEHAKRHLDMLKTEMKTDLVYIEGEIDNVQRQFENFLFNLHLMRARQLAQLVLS